MSVVVLIRHAEPEMDPERRATAWPLSVDGRRQVERLATHLAEYSIDRILTSPHLKAFDTARILAENLFVTLDVWEGLEEHDRRNVGWLGTTDFQSAVREAMERLDDVVLGEESLQAAVTRFEDAIRLAVEMHPGENIAVVTHGTVLSLFLAPRAGLEPFDLWLRLGMPAYAVMDENLSLLHLVTDLDD